MLGDEDKLVEMFTVFADQWTLSGPLTSFLIFLVLFGSLIILFKTIIMNL